MSGVTDGQSRLSCTDAGLLFERVVLEEPLGADEQQRLDAHISKCERCRNLVMLTQGLPVFATADSPPAVESDFDSMMAALKREREAARTRRVRWSAVGIAASIAAAAMVGLFFSKAPSDVPERPVAVAACGAGAPTELTTGVFMAQCAGAKTSVDVQDGTVNVSLDAGTVALYVDPERPVKRSVTVETPVGSVRVKGTVFSVAVDTGDTRVAVYRGTVEVVPESDGETYNVSAGRGTAIKKRSSFAVRPHDKDDPVAVLPVSLPATPPEEKPVAEVEDGEESSSPIDSADAGEVLNDDSSPTQEGRKKEPRHGEASRRVPGSMNDLIQSARSCLLARDWECAASHYREVLRTYSRRPEAAAVLISLAKIELRHLNQPQSALSRYRAYLDMLPNGPLAEEAVIGTAQAYRRLGLDARERETLQRFLERFPQSSLTDKARTRLTQLGERSSL